MSTVNRKRSLARLITPGRQQSAHPDTEWESVMVQITLAFVIILGYLVSKGISESENLAAETLRQRKQNQLLESIVADFSGSEVGRERAQRIAAQRENRSLRLINAWLKIRDERLFRRLVQQYRNAEQVVLSDDLKALPVESSFNDLNLEIERIFLTDKGDVSPDELRKLLNDVLTAEGYDLDAATELLELGRLSPQAAALHDAAQTPTWEDLNMLKSQIMGDLAAERSDLVQIQFALVEKIAAARVKKLVELPLDAGAETSVDVNAPDLGAVMLERILDDLRQEVRLLPETAKLIRGAENAAPAANQN